MYQSTDKDVVVLAIKPYYSHAIMSGEKKVEFRRNGTPINIKHIIVYSTSPDQQIIGHCEVIECVSASPHTLWRKYGARGSIKRKDFFIYYEGVNKGKCYILKNPQKFARPILLRNCWSFSKAPQSFTYLLKNEWHRLKRKKTQVVSK
jgi:predicted transcriptional regulator